MLLFRDTEKLQKMTQKKHYEFGTVFVARAVFSHLGTSVNSSEQSRGTEFPLTQ